MITHIFLAGFDHLSLPLIRNTIVSFSSQKHFFILYGKIDNSIKDKYDKLFNDTNFSNYIFIDRLSLFIKYIISRDNSHYVIHGTNNFILLSLILLGQKVSWICWGGGSYIYNTLKSRLLAKLKSALYKKCDNIVTLMADDCYSLKRDYNLDSVVMPYYPTSKESNREFFLNLQKDFFTNKKESPIKVLLGNNAHNRNNYLDILELIKHLNDISEVHCMMQYPRISEENLKSFENKCKSIFGKSVVLDINMMSEEKYKEYINSFDVYICAAENQTGLGAINTCLLLGKKIFLAGKNYNWITSLGNTVSHVSDLKNMTIEDFSKPLSFDVITYNFNNQYVGLEELKQKWTTFFDTISC